MYGRVSDIVAEQIAVRCKIIICSFLPLTTPSFACLLTRSTCCRSGTAHSFFRWGCGRFDIFRVVQLLHLLRLPVQRLINPKIGTACREKRRNDDETRKECVVASYDWFVAHHGGGGGADSAYSRQKFNLQVDNENGRVIDLEVLP